MPWDTDFSQADDLPFLSYPLYTFTNRDNANLELIFNMTLETDPDDRMEYDLRIDGGEVKKYRLTQDAGEQPSGWRDAVRNCVWKKNHNLGRVEEGSHTIEVRFRKPNMVLEKLVLSMSNVPYTYLGPPESDYVAEGYALVTRKDTDMLDLMEIGKLHI